LKNILIRLFFAFFFCLFSFFVCLESVDLTAYTALPCYQKTFDSLNRLQVNKLLTSHLPTQNVSAGWAKYSITPNFPVRFAGYGLRHKFEGIHDSLFVRAMIFEAANKQIAIVSMDLMMVHPKIAAKIREKARQLLPNLQLIYFTATHTHHGHGGWADGLVGWATLGGYDEKVFDLVVNQSLHALVTAKANKKPAKIGYGQIAANGFVQHRIDKQGKTDAWLRLIKIEQDKGKTAVIASFSAHNNALTHELRQLSNDYVGGFLAAIEQKTDFAMFAAGMVASHNPNCGGDSYQTVEDCGKKLADLALLCLPTIKMQEIKQLKWLSVPVFLREPQLRLAANVKLRTWLFEALVGRLDAEIVGLQIDNILLLGMPCDFSGELFEKIAIEYFTMPCDTKKEILEEVARQELQQNLFITSFNGNYVGYISDDKYYQTQHSEIRDMNWAAPESGAYFVEVTKKIVQKFSQ
jgi:neutral ceramidase